ncbi:importin subunit alpha-4 [Anaeramoeba flamelloides]|uniref:Importin subunit alpha n=1 Tax=Anaeramoeba flamelloides TaxID=1746091 RepID=A0ABQ8Z6A1_9EUKA|nr:importin subunit alpha-4 [Anaeramoeba flamelloides]
MSTFHKKLEKRRKQFKSTSTKERTIQRRYNQQIQISKAKREELLNKKRNLLPTNDLNIYQPEEIKKYIKILPQLAKQLQSKNNKEKTEASEIIRNLLSIPEDPPIDQVLQCKILPILVDLLQDPKEPDLQFNAAWIISNIASGLSEHTKLVVESNTIPIFVGLLGSKNEDIQLQVLPLMNVLKNMLVYSNREIIVEATTALGYLAEGSEKNIQLIIEHNIVSLLVALLKYNDNIIKFPSLRCIGNLITGNQEQIISVLDNGLIQYIIDFLQSQKLAIRKEACWILSNICTCTSIQIQDVLDEGALPHLIYILENDINQVIKEACYVISNMINYAKHSQCRTIASLGIIPILTRLLSNENQEIIYTCIESLDIFFKVEDADSELQNKELNEYRNQFEEEDGIKKIEMLMESKVSNIRKRAEYFYYIHIETLSDEEDDEESEDLFYEEL